MNESNGGKHSHYHRFLDEAGDTTFYGKGKTPILGENGVSKAFILGMLKVNEPLSDVREKVKELQNEIVTDPWFKDVPSIQKQIAKGGYYLHAKNDVQEVRKLAFEFIRNLDCSFEAVVARKDYLLYEKLHHGKESKFYADLLSHLLKNKFKKYDRLVLNIASRGQCTTHRNLEFGKHKAHERWSKTHDENHTCDVQFNVQQPTSEPLLNLADYFCWSIQRVFERGEDRYFQFISDKVSLVLDLYPIDGYKGGSSNYYRTSNPISSLNHLK